MIPSDYRLEQVGARLVERLDGARRSFVDPVQMQEGMARVAADHVDAAIAEWRELEWTEDPDAHAAFLRQEVLHTLLPRYVRAAWTMNEQEASGFGLGGLAAPLGRVALVASSLLVLWFVLLRFVAFPVVWPIILVDLGLVFLPDIAAWLAGRRYEQSLSDMVDDLGRIQEQVLAYAPAPRAHKAAPNAEPVKRPPPMRESQ